MSVNLAKHLFTVAQYERMGETGILAPEARVELIEGEIIEMPPIGSSHAAWVDLINDLSHTQLHGKAIVRIQSPIVLDDFSEPEPDVAILKFREDFYRNGHPQPGDIMLVIEVSESTVRFDRQVKARLYARAGIPEFLLFNVPDEELEHYSQPESSTYKSRKILKRGDIFQSAIVPGLTLDIETILG